MTVDLELLAGWLGALTAVSAPVWVFMRRANELLLRLRSLESWTRKQQLDIEKSQRERSLLISGTLACLKGLREQGVNGAVSKSISDIESFLFEEATKGMSENVVAKSVG